MCAIGFICLSVLKRGKKLNQHKMKVFTGKCAKIFILLFNFNDMIWCLCCC